MTDLTRLSQEVSDTIRNTNEYREYESLLREIKKDPVLYEKVTAMRERNFRIQQNESGDAFELMDALTNEYEDVINIELVSEFMQAEVALCDLVRNFNLELVEGLEFD